jgi:hypothetical protein
VSCIWRKAIGAHILVIKRDLRDVGDPHLPAGFNSIAVRSAAMLNEALRRLPQMPSTEIGFASLIISLQGCFWIDYRIAGQRLPQMNALFS